MNAPIPPDAVAVASLPVFAIGASPSNPRKRFDDAYIAELADSIRHHGLIQPITVRPLSLDGLFAFNKRAHPDDPRPTYEIVVGECRWRAAKVAGLTDIPAFWRDLDDKQVLEIQVVENLQRRDVHPIEEAEGYQQLIDRHGYTADAIAAKIGKSRSYVYGRLKFADLCRDARDAFYEGRLDASTALLVARIPGETLQKKATKEITCGYDNQPLSFRNAKSHIHYRYTLSLKQATFSPDDATLLPAAGNCTDCPKRSGNCRDLFNDIDDADVCTDPDCFEAKRLARRDRLIANAEKRKIPVFLGNDARVALNGDKEYISLDANVEDDAQGRTYRQILGDTVQPEALIEFPYGQRDLGECAEMSTLEAALRKAGWMPQEDDGHTVHGNLTPEQQREAELQRNKREAEARLREEDAARRAEAETARRQTLLSASFAALHALAIAVSEQADALIHALAVAWLRQQMHYCGLSDEEDLLIEHIGEACRLPDEYDEAREIERLSDLIDAAPLGRVLALMFRAMVTEEMTVHWHNIDKPGPTIDALAALLKVQPETALPVDAPAEIDDRAQGDDSAIGAPIRTRNGELPNEHGVYCCEPTLKLTWTRGNNRYEITFLALENGEWISQRAYTFGSSSASGPFTRGGAFVGLAEAFDFERTGAIEKSETLSDMPYAHIQSFARWAEALEQPADPSTAAQANDKGAAASPVEGKAGKKAAKKPKSKADPAPALPANEPAAPVKTSTPDLLPAWPFPLGART